MTSQELVIGVSDRICDVLSRSYAILDPNKIPVALDTKPSKYFVTFRIKWRGS